MVWRAPLICVNWWSFQEFLRKCVSLKAPVIHAGDEKRDSGLSRLETFRDSGDFWRIIDKLRLKAWSKDAGS
jgi:hypothetical protein